MDVSVCTFAPEAPMISRFGPNNRARIQKSHRANFRQRVLTSTYCGKGTTYCLAYLGCVGIVMSYLNSLAYLLVFFSRPPS